jgi:redox-sensitive bicupin YhaK (pirin superfamily)
MSPPGEDGLDLRQDARVWVSLLTSGTVLTCSFGEHRGGYAYVIDGDAAFNGRSVQSGDAAKIHGPEALSVEATSSTELIVIDAPLRYRPIGVWARR